MIFVQQNNSCMPNTNKDPQKSIDFISTVVDYKDGDIILFDNVEMLSSAFPPKPKTTLLGICCQGKINLSVNGQDLAFSTGDVLLCPPNVKVGNSLRNKEFDCKAIVLSDDIIQGLIHDKMETWNRMVYINQMYKISLNESCRQELDLYYKLIRSKLLNKTYTTSFHTIQSLLRAMLLDLCVILEDLGGGDMVEDRPSQGKMLFNRFLSILSNNEVKRQPISVYASRLAITPKYLTMLCLKYSDKTASDWVIQYTVEDIRFYLRNSNLSIKEITAKMGFLNMSHFGSYVRKHMGLSPSAFRHKK